MPNKPTYEELEKRVQELELVELKRKRTEEELDQIFSMSLDMICIADINTATFIKINPAFTEILGYSAEALLEKPFFDFIHPEDIDATQAVIEKELQKGTKVINFDNRYRCKDGSYRWLSWVSHPSMEKGITFAVAQDITDRKWAEIALMKSEKKWRDILINTPQIGIVLNPNDEISFANAHFLKLTGWEEQEVIGRNWFDMFIPENIREEVRGVFKTVMNQKGTHGLSTYENEIMVKDGTLKNIAWSNVLTKDAQSAIVDVTCLGIDLTERKQAEEALRKSEERLNLIIKGSNDAPWDWDLGRNELYYSPQWWRQLGYGPDEVTADAALWERLLHPEDAKHVDSIFRVALKNSLASYEVEFRLLHKDGHYVPILSRGFITRDKTGNPIRVTGTNMDLSERKQAEEQQRQSEDKLRATLDATPFPVAVVDLKDDKIFYWSTSAHDLFGHTASTTSEWYQIAYPDPDYRQDAIERWKPFLEIARTSGRPVNTGEYRITCKDGTERICELYATLLPDNLIVTFNDITDRKKTEASLYAIEWLLNKPLEKRSYRAQSYGGLTVLNTNRLILDSIDEDVLTDIMTGYLELLETSAAVYESNGDYAQGIFSSGWCRMLDSASRSLCQTEDNAEALACGKWHCHESCWTDASKISIQKGEPVDIVCNGGLGLYAIPIKASDKIIGAINFGYGDPPKELDKLNIIAEKYQIDVKKLIKAANQYKTRPKFIIEIAKKRLQSSAKLIGALVEIKIAQSKLQAEREKLKVTLQSIGDGVITTDIEGNVVIINKVAEIMTGWPQKEGAGKKLNAIFHIINEQTQQRCENPVERVLKTNKIVELANNTILIARDGTQKIIADSAAPIVDNHGSTLGVVLVFRDISEKVELENALRHSHKMEAIGNLAGGIAHEFNNILSIILGNNELIMEDLPNWALARENAEEIKIAGMRARDVVKQLLTFSRQDSAERKVIDIKSVVNESMKLIRSSIPANIRIVQNLADDVYPIIANDTQINQLLINLCSNAADAMENMGDTITVDLKNSNINETIIKFQPVLKPGKYVRLIVSDNGMGMDEKTLDRIFDPYYTTKDIGKGTGIGLAIVHGIVKRHNGSILADSHPAKGSIFTIFLPAHEGLFEVEKDEHIALPTGDERILYVDDEPSIAKLGQLRLKSLGYSAESTTDPLVALEMLKADIHKFDLVITDMAMPNMTGDQLIAEILRLRPGMPTIICTGYSSKISEKEAAKIGISSFVMKPLEKADLAKTVRLVLDKAKSNI